MTNIFLVGEAYGEKEEELGLPFVGASGYILDGMLAQVGLSRHDCRISNVFNLRPKPRNDVINLCGSRAEGIPGLPILMKGKYVRAEYAQEIERLYADIRLCDPNIIVALGATAAWALLHTNGIKPIRGYVAQTHPLVSAKLGREYKVLPTYHPAAVARDWSLRPVTIMDLDKAKRESETPTFIRPERTLWIEPTLEDLSVYEREHIANASILSVDIETWQDQITCIGFAPSDNSGIVIPFITERSAGHSYWKELGEELLAWSYVKNWLGLKPSIFQNGMYDIQFLWRSYGIPVPLAQEDTMLLHHAWQPELEKGLGFLASVYTNEAAWKYMRKGMKHD